MLFGTLAIFKATGLDLPFKSRRYLQRTSAFLARAGTSIHGGLGLGLAIVRQLVELRGGAVHAESGDAGRGASFIVLLPTRTAFQRAERKSG